MRVICVSRARLRAACGIATIACALIGAKSTFADPPEREIGLETVLSYGLATSPLVREIDAKIAERLAESVSIRILPNPELSVGVAAPVTDSERTNQYGVSITQPFRLSHTGLRQTVSTLMNDAARNEQRFAVLELTENIRLAYVRLWAIQSQRSYFVDASKRAGQAAQFVRNGSVKGLYTQGEERLFNATSERASADLTGLDAAIEKAAAELIRLTGFPLAGQILSRPVAASASDLADLTLAAESSTLPIQNRLSLVAKLASERAKLAKRDAFPALSPQLNYSRNEDGVEFVGASLTLELPFFNRNQSERLQRSAELEAANARNQYVEGESFKSELGRLVKSVKGSFDQARAYEDKVLPSLQSAVSTYERQLRAGQGSILLVWQAQRELLDLQGRQLEIWVRAFSEQSELVILTGKAL